MLLLIQLVWAPAKAAADRERVALLEYVRATEGNGKGEGSSALIETIEPWDWRYYAEKVRALVVIIIMIPLISSSNRVILILLYTPLCCAVSPLHIYTCQVRASRYDVNEEEIKPYFSLDRMCEAIFDCAHKLFRLKFLRRADIATYHPDVAAYEVFRETDGQGDQLVGVFLHGKSPCNIVYTYYCITYHLMRIHVHTNMQTISRASSSRAGRG